MYRSWLVNTLVTHANIKGFGLTPETWLHASSIKNKNNFFEYRKKSIVLKPQICAGLLLLVVFPQSQFHCENVLGVSRYHPSAQLHLGYISLWFTQWWLWSWVGFWSFYSVEHVGSYLRVLESLSRTFLSSTDQLWVKIDLLGCSPCIGYHWFVVYWA